ncbi:MAG: AcrB/AcrD/AcrF family protein [Acidobacteriaceae bacterium]
MYQPETYAIALGFMFVSMVCWGSWANTVKLCPTYRFQLFYWDFVIGLFVGVFVWGWTLGSIGDTSRHFLADIAAANTFSIAYAILGGVVYNAANLLLVAAIEIAGLAVAFPVAIGLALIVGAVSSYILSPAGNPVLLFGGIALVVAAIVCDAFAYRMREQEHRAMSKRGLVVSLVSGVLMGSFYPLVANAMELPHAPGPYATSFYFTVGAAACSLVFNSILMRRPLDGKPPVGFAPYIQAPFRWHVWGIVGGCIGCTGTVFNFVASRANIVGPAVSYSIGQGATMISAGWGVFAWKEFAGAPLRSKKLLALMFALFIVGLCAIAFAPIFRTHSQRETWSDESNSHYSACRNVYRGCRHDAFRNRSRTRHTI